MSITEAMKRLTPEQREDVNRLRARDGEVFFRLGDEGEILEIVEAARVSKFAKTAKFRLAGGAPDEPRIGEWNT